MSKLSSVLLTSSSPWPRWLCCSMMLCTVAQSPLSAFSINLRSVFVRPWSQENVTHIMMRVVNFRVMSLYLVHSTVVSPVGGVVMAVVAGSPSLLKDDVVAVSKHFLVKVCAHYLIFWIASCSNVLTLLPSRPRHKRCFLHPEIIKLRWIITDYFHQNTTHKKIQLAWLAVDRDNPMK